MINKADVLKGWDYYKAVLLEGENAFAKQDKSLWYASGFCKTQFSDNVIEHKWVADILKVVASRCQLVSVYDEGDYYHSGVIEDATNGIYENGQMIDKVAGMLGGLGFKDDIIKGFKVERKENESH
jgi:hypothetical protein